MKDILSMQRDSARILNHAPRHMLELTVPSPYEAVGIDPSTVGTFGVTNAWTQWSSQPMGNPLMATAIGLAQTGQAFGVDGNVQGSQSGVVRVFTGPGGELIAKGESNRLEFGVGGKTLVAPAAHGMSVPAGGPLASMTASERAPFLRAQFLAQPIAPMAASPFL